MTPAAETRSSGSVARAAALGALALAVVLVAALIFKGGETTYKLRFQNAGQLVKGDEVQVGGRRIGTIKEIRLTDDNQAEVEIGVQEEFAPLHQGTTALIRATSLSGIANRYIALNPGRNDAPELAEGTVLGAEKAIAPVDLDQLFNTLDKNTRDSLSKLIKGFAVQYAGQERNANLSALYFAPALSSTQRLVNELTRDEPALTRFLVDSSRLVTALAERRTDLASLVGNANATTAAIAQESAALDQALTLLPNTLRHASSTLVNLRSTLDDLDPLISESKPATKDLARFLRELRPLVAAARPTIADLRKSVTTPGANNDLVDATRKLPRLQRAATPTFRNTVLALRRGQPVIEFIRPYFPDLVGWLRDFGNGASNYDANGHFARIQPIFNTFSLTNLNTLQPIAGLDRLAGFQRGLNRRCPGAASQPAQDGSAPYRDASGNLDCDPSQTLPGP